ncbi:MAG: acyl carrier protein [Candidatus Accumulibacter phosphatis]|jgi:acyl carrier protein|uniref:Acyl carrier protein n=2 Tax=Candidatus Accumulibacter TaxID=327159 RepID=A0A011PJ69_9PROT|nr:MULTISPECIES: acyl carrier protein [unclassified Candidatus Accumulibacter]EXI77092.1 MAG: acyl carrier protein [Candidatus Accumulibacter appositus]KFB73954.1 MAG: acyl carrier protein [Candidatus Accumulibacter phosphatis]MCB1933450.1 acyl carrier protein [Accumulibacter sp.]MCB1964748.1 acyl carrier protein [Accumulibacter sp.]
MNDQELRAAVLSVVRTIAPELDAERIEADKPLRNQIDLDSMDWLNVILALREKFRVDIPESDYGKVQTLNAIVAYLGARPAPHSPG